MEEAKKKVVVFLEGIMYDHADEELIDRILNNYYLFLENLLEREPHKKGSIQKENLESLKIKKTNMMCSICCMRISNPCIPWHGQR